jgi:hypothetical protein
MSKRSRPPAATDQSARQARPFPRGPQQLLEVGARPFRDQLDCAVVSVADPTAQSQHFGMADQEESKADPLHLSMDDGM